MKKNIKIILCMLLIFLLAGCGSKRLNETKEKVEKQEEVEKKEVIETLSEDDDLFAYLTKYNNTLYYRPLVTYTFVDGYKEYESGVEIHLLYYKDNYVYDVEINSSDAKKLSFDDISDKVKEYSKYKIIDLKLNEDKEIYLSSVNDKNNEFHMVFRYFDNDYKKLVISKGNSNDGYEVYNYYYNRLDAYNEALDKQPSNKPSKPTIGMSASEVRNTKWGAPDKINKDTYSWGTTEQWVYKSHGYVYFENGKVTSISER